MDSQKEQLYWRCRRGMLELDELLQSFLDQGFDKLDDEQRVAFQQLIRLQDQELLPYLLGQTLPTDGKMAHVVNCIRHAYRP